MSATGNGARWRRRLAEAAVVVFVLAALYAWRLQDMLDTGRDVPAPPLRLATLDGDVRGLRDADGRPALVYFFAPWCRICSASAHNLRNLRRLRDEEDLAIFLVALDWTSREEVRAYVERHDLGAPVLLGNRQVSAEWGIAVYPTYYTLDSEHRVRRRDFGYSTLAGLWLRTLLR